MTERRRLRVAGTVQGVGFRPFVHRHAIELGLHGTVANDAHGVVIEAEGPAAALDELARRIVDEPPPRARVTEVGAVALTPTGDSGGFAIVASTQHRSGALEPAAVGADIAICQECLDEVRDPDDRRHRYPFTNCTNCGPRYTIVRSVPYDRPATTMAAFTLCRRCQAEYDDPSDRRFHAQPNACPRCGPTLSYLGPGGTHETGDTALHAAAAALWDGAIVAVKGIGGFHLAVDARNEDAVRRLRHRKHRDDKPFAVMVPDVSSAEALIEPTSVTQDALTGWRRPVVLCARRAGAPVAAAVAPGSPDLGIVVAYTALHHLLLEEVGRPLVMTSANISDEPIAFRDDAMERLGGVADALLTHDRAIHVPCEDSVVRDVLGGPQVLRRGRGFAPEPFALGGRARRQVLAVGAELKSTVSVVRGATLVTGPHLGDLEHAAAFAAFEDATRRICALMGVAPDVIAHDLHPEYLSTKWARETDLPLVGVQHHHAHVASCLVDHGRHDQVLGVAFDGLGLGDDGGLWGGEFLVADRSGFTRVGHLAPVALPGGSRAIREPWRMAIAWAHQALGPGPAGDLAAELDPRGPTLLGLLTRGDIHTTTSAGRLFDAVAGLLGLRSVATYEGQAAIELEALARTVSRADAPSYPVDVRHDGDRTVLDPAPLVAAVVTERGAGTAPALIAAGAHEGLGRATARLAGDLAVAAGLSTVALTGGVFQNRRLTEVIAGDLTRRGLEVLVHRRIPPNDGGISTGQAAIAAAAPDAATVGATTSPIAIDTTATGSAATG